MKGSDIQGRIRPATRLPPPSSAAQHLERRAHASAHLDGFAVRVGRGSIRMGRGGVLQESDTKVETANVRNISSCEWRVRGKKKKKEQVNNSLNKIRDRALLEL